MKCRACSVLIRDRTKVLQYRTERKIHDHAIIFKPCIGGDKSRPIFEGQVIETTRYYRCEERHEWSVTEFDPRFANNKGKESEQEAEERED